MLVATFQVVYFLVGRYPLDPASTTRGTYAAVTHPLLLLAIVAFLRKAYRFFVLGTIVLATVHAFVSLHYLASTVSIIGWLLSVNSSLGDALVREGPYIAWNLLALTAWVLVAAYLTRSYVLVPAGGPAPP